MSADFARLRRNLLKQLRPHFPDFRLNSQTGSLTQILKDSHLEIGVMAVQCASPYGSNLTLTLGVAINVVEEMISASAPSPSRQVFPPLTATTGLDYIVASTAIPPSEVYIAMNSTDKNLSEYGERIVQWKPFIIEHLKELQDMDFVYLHFQQRKNDIPFDIFGNARGASYIRHLQRRIVLTSLCAPDQLDTVCTESLDAISDLHQIYKDMVSNLMSYIRSNRKT